MEDEALTEDSTNLTSLWEQVAIIAFRSDRIYRLAFEPLNYCLSYLPTFNLTRQNNRLQPYAAVASAAIFHCVIVERRKKWIWHFYSAWKKDLLSNFLNLSFLHRWEKIVIYITILYYNDISRLDYIQNV